MVEKCAQCNGDGIIVFIDPTHREWAQEACDSCEATGWVREPDTEWAPINKLNKGITNLVLRLYPYGELDEAEGILYLRPQVTNAGMDDNRLLEMKAIAAELYGRLAEYGWLVRIRL